MNTPTAVKPGALALAYIKRDAAAWTPEYRDAVKDMRALLAERDAAVQHAEQLAADVRAMRRSLLIIAQGRTTDAMRVASDALLDHDDRQVKP